MKGTHDGALPQERPSFEPDLADHETRHVDEKQQIARAALDELPEEGAVLLDACAPPRTLLGSSRTTVS